MELSGSLSPVAIPSAARRPRWPTRLWLVATLVGMDFDRQVAGRMHLVRSLFVVLFYGAAIGSLRQADRIMGDLLGQGNLLLWTLVSLSLWAIVLLVPAAVGGSLSLEREQKTLELVLLADVSVWQLLVAKLAGRLLPILALLLLSLPLMGVGYVLGGMTVGDAMMATAWLAVACLEVGAVSLLASSLAGSSAGGVLLAYLLTAVLLATPASPHVFPPARYTLGPLTGWTSNRWVYPEGWQGGIGIVAPWSTTQAGFAVLVGLRLAVAVGALAAAGHVLRHETQRARSGYLLALFRRLDRLYERCNVLCGEVLVHREVDLPGKDPLAWRERRRLGMQSARHLVRWVLLLTAPLLGLCIAVSLLFWGRSSIDVLSLCWCGAWLAAAVVLAVQGVAAIVAERARGTLDDLLLTPLQPHQVVGQKALAGRRPATLAALVLLGLWVYRQALVWAVSEELPALSQAMVIAAMTMIYLPVCGWLGMWCGLRSRGRLRPYGLAIGIVVVLSVLPWVWGMNHHAPGRGVGAWWFTVPSPAAVVMAQVDLLSLSPPGWVTAMNLILFAGVYLVLRGTCLRRAEAYVRRP